jgi:hypothetical protein
MKNRLAPKQWAAIAHMSAVERVPLSLARPMEIVAVHDCSDAKGEHFEVERIPVLTAAATYEGGRHIGTDLFVLDASAGIVLTLEEFESSWSSARFSPVVLTGDPAKDEATVQAAAAELKASLRGVRRRLAA